MTTRGLLPLASISDAIECRRSCSRICFELVASEQAGKRPIHVARLQGPACAASEHVGVGEREEASGLLAVAVGDQCGHSHGGEVAAGAAGVGLGRHHAQLPIDALERPNDPEGAGREVDITPTERELLASS